MIEEEDPLALIYAICDIRDRNTLDEIYDLIIFGFDVNNKNHYNGWTALMAVAQHGREHGAGIMRLLIDKKADVDEQNDKWETALMIAIEHGKEHATGMMRLLIDAGADVDEHNYDRETALMIAVKHGQEQAAEMMRLLIDAGADVNKQDDEGSTALMLAARWGHKHAEAMMCLLIEAKADVNKQDEDGDTSLMIVAQFGNEHAMGMMRLLIDAGADVNKQDVDGDTTLLIIAQNEDEYEYVEDMVRLLVAHGTTLPPGKELPSQTPPELTGYIHGAQNWSPLHRAADARDADAIIKCLSEGMRPYDEVESPHPHMRTALSIAESTSYPTAQPVCDDCLALLRPSLMKGGAPIVGSLFGGGGGGGAQTES